MSARDQRGMVLPATAMVATICTIAAAAVGFVLSAHPHRQSPPAPRPVSSAHRVTPTPTSSPTSTPHRDQARHQARHQPRVDKKSTYVEVFNNSNIRGLAGRTATRAQDAGWNVVGADNWYGTVDASTVYFPRGMRAAAVALGHDLGISRFKPAIQPMKLDRLTVILTADYAG
jgi:hypothetical protein